MPVGSGGGRYVPPHLRGSGNASNGNGNTTNTRGGGGGGSRWNNLGEGSSDRNSNGHGYGRSYNNNNNSSSSRNARGGGHGRDRDRGGSSAFHSPSNGAGSGTGTTNSRWANVDRSKVAAGTQSGHRNNNNDDHHHRHHHHRNNHNSRNRHEGVEAVFFGDSFIKLFGLLNDYTDSVPGTPRRIEVHKYKAASAKGLCREGNGNRDKIRFTVDAIKRSLGQPRDGSHGAYRKLERLVFCFGSVDVHMSYYFKKFAQNQALTEEDLRAIATDYVDFVAGLETGREERPLSKLVVGIYPSPLRDCDVGASLLAYGSLENDDQVEAVNNSEDRWMNSRQARVRLFNRALRERCEFHNNKNADSDKNNGPLEYRDVVDRLLTESGDGTVVVKDAYRDVSDLNIHLIHETTLQLWVDEWPWYKTLTRSHTGGREGAGFLEYLQETFDEYRKTKPWAERTHVAETEGVQLA